MQSVDCPSHDAIRHWAMGILSDAEAEQIADHLDACLDCERLLESIERQGFLQGAEAIPVAARYVEEPHCEKFVEALQHRLRRIPSNGANPLNRDVWVGRRIRDYELIERLGQGAMGAVYKAQHTRLKKLVAIKLLADRLVANPAAEARFEREMQAVGQLEHPQIVRALDAGEADGVTFLVMELVDGVDLAQLTSPDRLLRVADACEIVRQAAIGLHYAHRNGLVHRDIKPSNLMLTREADGECRVKVLDLGLAMIGDAEGHQQQLTDDGQLMGTLEFMAPEQAEDTRSVDHRADVYSLGATLYRLLTGALPLAGPELNAPVKRLMALVSSPAPSIATRRDDLPAGLIELVDRMLDRDPVRRPQTLKEVSDFLATLSQDCDLESLLSSATVDPSVGDPAAADDGQTEIYAPSHDTDAKIENEADTQIEPAAPLPPASIPAIGHTTPQATPAPETAGDRKIPPWIAVSVAAGLAGAAILLAAIVLFLKTPHGTLRIEINDPSIEVTVSGDERYRVKGKNGEFEIAPGDHILHINAGGTEFQTKEFTIGNGDEVDLRVSLLDGKTLQVAEGDKVLDEHTLPRPDVAANRHTPSRPPLDATPARAANAKPPADAAPLALSGNLAARIEAARGIVAGNGGMTITVDGVKKAIQKPDDVPTKPFSVEYISFGRPEDFTSDQTARIMLFSELPRLWVCGQVTIDDVRKLATLPRLESLNLGKACRFSLDDLASVRGFARVKTLNLDSELFNGKLDLTNFPSLEELILSVPARDVTALAEVPNLRTALLFACGVTDDGLNFATPPQQLESLRIDKCGLLTDACLPHIGRIKTLKSFEIVNNGQVTRAGVEALRKQLPQCQITWGETYNTRIKLPPLSRTP